MSHERRRPFSAQREIDLYTKQQVARAAGELDCQQTDGELLAFLTDETKLTLPGSVLCRQIRSQGRLISQAAHASLSRCCSGPWPHEVVSRAAAELSDISSSRHGLAISAAQWEQYLAGDLPQVLQRDVILQLAVVTGMGREATIELLMACGQAPYQLRRPLELICWYIQCIPNLIFTWRDVERLLDMYETLAAAEDTGVKTEQRKPAGDSDNPLHWSVDEILGIGDPAAEGEQALMELMRKTCTATGGVSRTARSAYLRLLEYLTALDLPERPADLREQTGDMAEGQAQRTLFCKRYLVQASAIRSGVTAVNRQDVLLLGYFLITAYMRAEERGRASFLTMTEAGRPVDRNMAHLRKDLDALHPDSDAKEKQVLCCRILNELLAEFGFHAFYVPAAFDRFILLSLITGHPFWSVRHLLGRGDEVAAWTKEPV